MAEAQVSERPKIYTLERYSMLAKPVSAAAFRKPKLEWGIMKGCPRITVYFNPPEPGTAENGWNMISVGMNPETFRSFVDKFMVVIDGPNGGRDHITNYGSTRTEDGKPGERIKKSVLFFGKDDKGIVWISLTSVDETKPKIKFEYFLSEWHEFLLDGRVINGEPEGSVMQARSTIKMLTGAYEKLCAAFKEPNTNPNSVSLTFTKTKTQSKPTDLFDDDITF